MGEGRKIDHTRRMASLLRIDVSYVATQQGSTLAHLGGRVEQTHQVPSE